MSLFSLPEAPRLTPWQAHVDRWRDCRLCNLSYGRQNVVLAKGRVPADVLFTGEAPGHSEDAIGLPFEGPAGMLLIDQIVAEALAPEVRVAYANLVCCIPLGEDGTKSEQPDPADIVACSGRLREFVALAKPKLIVCVGALAEGWLMGTKRISLLEDYWGRMSAIVHPAYILRANVAQQGLLIKRCVVTVANAWEAARAE